MADAKAPERILSIALIYEEGKFDRVGIVYKEACPEGPTQHVLASDGSIREKPVDIKSLTIEDRNGDGIPDMQFLPCGEGTIGIDDKAKKILADVQKFSDSATAMIKKDGLVCTKQPAGMRCDGSDRIVIFSNGNKVDPLSEKDQDDVFASKKNLVMTEDTNGDGIPDKLYASIHNPTYGLVSLFGLPIKINREDLPTVSNTGPAAKPKGKE